MKDSLSSQHIRDEFPMRGLVIRLGILITAGTLLRLFRLDAQSLWIDEAWQYAVAGADSVMQVINGALAGANPPLSHLVNHLFFSAGSSDFILRLPSALFGILSLPLFYLLVKKIIPGKAALFSLFVFAFSPLHIWYSQEGRMYAQLIYLVLLNHVLLLKALEKSRVSWWGLYALTLVLGFSTQVFMMFVVFSQLPWVIQHYRHRMLPFSVSIVVSILPFVPFAGLFLHSLTVSMRRCHGTWFSLGTLPYTFFAYSAGFSLGPSFVALHGNRSLDLILKYLPSIIAVGAVFSTLLILGVGELKNRNEGKWLTFCLSGLFVPLVGTMVYYIFLKYDVRYTIVALRFFCIIVGSGLAFLKRYSRPLYVLAMGAFVFIIASSLYNYYVKPTYAKADVKSAIVQWRLISKKELLFSNWLANPTVNRYLADEERTRHFPLLKNSNSSEAMAGFLDSHKNSSFYVLLSRDWNQKIEKKLRNTFTIKKEYSFPRVKLLFLGSNIDK